jgi:hypothetical protein
MQRKTFLKISTLSAVASLLGIPRLISNDKVIDIGAPKFHVRHGLFDLNSNEGLDREIKIQRDVLTRNGLEEMDPDRLTSIKISNGDMNDYGLITKDGLSGNMLEIQAVKIPANSSKVIETGANCIVFSEYADFQINGKEISNDQGILSTSDKLKLGSKVDQFVLIYGLK